MADAAQKGEIPMSKLRGAAASMAKMKPSDLKEFAGTSEKGLPGHVEKRGHKSPHGYGR